MNSSTRALTKLAATIVTTPNFELMLIQEPDADYRYSTNVRTYLPDVRHCVVSRALPSRRRRLSERSAGRSIIPALAELGERLVRLSASAKLDCCAVSCRASTTGGCVSSCAQARGMRRDGATPLSCASVGTLSRAVGHRELTGRQSEQAAVKERDASSATPSC